MSKEIKKLALVIDDEAVVCLSCEHILSPEGFEVHCLQDPQLGVAEALTGVYDIILLDIVMPGMDGLEVLSRIKQGGVTSEVVIITGYATVETAVEAMRKGAADYVRKPFTPEELKIVIHKVVQRSDLIKENLTLRRELQVDHGFEGIVGESPKMQRVFSVIRRVASSDGTVLLTGESGTGKEMVARAIHRLSDRKNGPFMACDCSALVPSLLESELFGHVRGSFSGAVATKRGLFEAADKGTLFLDEISNISLETQGKLLRVLETRMIRKVGSTDEREVDIRLIAASNRDLDAMVKDGTFREDLFYRLNVVPLQLPPLRERKGDIPRLAMILLEQIRAKENLKVEGFTPEAMALLESYAWPGNVRELKNVIKRLAILCDAPRVEPCHLPPEISRTPVRESISELPKTWDAFKELKTQIRDSTVKGMERRFLVEALRRADHNVTRAAESVGMQRTNFHALLKKHGLSSDEESS